MGTGSSGDPLRAGLMFLGVLSLAIILIIFACFVWKLIEALIEKYRQKSVTQRHEKPAEGEVQVEVVGRHRLQLTNKIVEMLKSMLPDSAAITGRLKKNSTMPEEQEHLCAAAAARAKDSINPTEIV